MNTWEVKEDTASYTNNLTDCYNARQYQIGPFQYFSKPVNQGSGRSLMNVLRKRASLRNSGCPFDRTKPVFNSRCRSKSTIHSASLTSAFRLGAALTQGIGYKFFKVNREFASLQGRLDIGTA